MPIFDFYCEKCKKTEEHMVSSDKKVKCKCGEEMKKVPSYSGYYKIKGDNSASVTPKSKRPGKVTYNE